MKIRKLFVTLFTAAFIAGNFLPTTATTINASEVQDIESLDAASGRYSFLNTLDNSAEIASREGMVGRFYVPDVGINIALFDVTGMPLAERSPYVDGEDNGLWQESKNLVVIGDHNGEGFETIADITPGETLCYVQSGKNVMSFRCVEKGIGSNVTTALLDENGQSLTARKGYAVLTYCCADPTGKSIYYALWVPEEPNDEAVH